MTRRMMWIGFLATMVILVVLIVDVGREAARQDEAVNTIRTSMLAEGTSLYAQNCVVCHGTAGEGTGAVPPLNSEGLRNADYETIFHTIERGRFNTAMAAYSTKEGGVFTSVQIDSLVTLVQYGNWTAVSAQVAGMGLTPPKPKTVELSADMLTKVRSLPDGAAIANGLSLYTKNCTSCHGSNAEGTKLAPALNTAELRTRLTDADITRIISQGVPGTLMASWSKAMSTKDIADITLLIRRWDNLTTAGIALPTVEAAPIDMSPAAIATGQQLYSVLCAQCHGKTGYGTRLAPALNSKTLLEQTSNTAIQQIIAQGVQGTAMPAWGGRLSEADIAAITAYLRSLEPTAPAIVQSNATKPTQPPQ